MQNDQSVHAIVASLPDRFDGLDVGWLRAADALDALVARVEPRFPWPGVEGAVVMLRIASPFPAVDEPQRSVLPPMPMHFCDGPSCPGLPYRASEITHPTWCAEPRVGRR